MTLADEISWQVYCDSSIGTNEPVERQGLGSPALRRVDLVKGMAYGI
jgi:hypothetical protein